MFPLTPCMHSSRNAEAEVNLRMKGVISRLVLAALSVMALILALRILSLPFMPSRGGSAAFEKKGNVAETNGIFLERDNSIDVLFVGDSEAYTSFAPLQMWSEYGFTSYVCATAGQQMPYSLSILRRATASQRPRVVVIETDLVYRPTTIEFALCRAFQDLFPIFEFHDQWKNLLKSSAEGQRSVAELGATKGFVTTAASKPADASSHMAEGNRAAKIPFKNKQYLWLMIDYCKHMGAMPLLVSTPSTVNWNTARHNGIASFAKEVGVAYIDLNVAPTKVAIDWATDTRDAGDHMNVSGAKKVSKYMGAYLSKAYGLADRRGDASYQAWNDACARSGLTPS